VLLSVGKYSKFIVSVLGTVAVGLSAFGHNATWVPLALSAISAVSVYLVPNASAAPPAAPVQPPAGP
jgi:hypothetical protein